MSLPTNYVGKEVPRSIVEESHNNGEIFSVSFDEDNPDAYTFNNQGRGDKIIKEGGDGKGTGSFGDAIREFRAARESGAGLKAAIESAASIRGVDVQADNRSTIVDEETMEKYRREYEKYLNSSPERIARINQRMRGRSN